MTGITAAVVAALVLLGIGLCALRRWLHRLGRELQRAGVLHELDGGLATSMRDCDTRRNK